MIFWSLKIVKFVATGVTSFVVRTHEIRNTRCTTVRRTREPALQHACHSFFSRFWGIDTYIGLYSASKTSQTDRPTDRGELAIKFGAKAYENIYTHVDGHFSYLRWNEPRRIKKLKEERNNNNNKKRPNWPTLIWLCVSANALSHTNRHIHSYDFTLSFIESRLCAHFLFISRLFTIFYHVHYWHYLGWLVAFIQELLFIHTYL